MTDWLALEPDSIPYPIPDDETENVGDWDEPITLQELTCFECDARKTCEYVDDLYNTDGDCLAFK